MALFALRHSKSPFGCFASAALHKASFLHGSTTLCGRTMSSGIKIFDEKEMAEENLYMKKEDERLLKKMIENDPNLDPNVKGIDQMIDDGASLTDKVKMIFIKHGIPPVNRELVADLVALIEQQT
eukprot:TRINITY_DN77254_c0_g1_i1.p1 TRINITY_DN77254_c0_g1~~TRINITY_DN77254_c0_g1_i1.p1  ORF type:complete len:125 (+),score=33.50 TRINITY_DN77254_c0_g1_i1:84-458(+)